LKFLRDYFCENGQSPDPPPLQWEKSEVEVAAGLTLDLLLLQPVQLLLQPDLASAAAAGLTFALLQHADASVAAAGLTEASLAAASGHPAALAFTALHFARSQFARSQIAPSQSAAVALAFTFSVLLQPYAAKPTTATSVSVKNCFIGEFSISMNVNVVRGTGFLIVPS
jgi:hypothetical protein